MKKQTNKQTEVEQTCIVRQISDETYSDQTGADPSSYHSPHKRVVMEYKQAATVGDHKCNVILYDL